MRYLQVLLIVLLLQNAGHSQCDEISTSEYALLEICEDSVFTANKWCDTRYQYVVDIFRAKKSRNLSIVNELFLEFLGDFDESTKIDSVEIMILHAYAEAMYSFDRNEAGDYFSQFIIENTRENSIYSLLSSALLAIKNNSSQSIRSLSESMRKGLLEIESPDEKALFLMSSLLVLNDETTLDKRFLIDVYDGIVDSNLKGIYFNYLFFYLVKKKLLSEKEVSELFFEAGNVECANIRGQKKYLLSYVESQKKNYELALRIADEGVRICTGISSDVNEIINWRKNKGDQVCDDMISRFAHAKLYMTRLGHGLPPVKEAFDLYEVIERGDLEVRILKSEKLNFNKVVSDEDRGYDLLIVGTYLFQKTNNYDYLNRSISTLEMLDGGTLQQWIKKRDEISENPDLALLIDEEAELYNRMAALDSTAHLRQAFDLQQRIEEIRNTLNKDYPEILSLGEDEYKVDLEELQGDMAQDSAGLLAFYELGKSLYRLYVNKDTIDIQVFSHLRKAAITLTQEVLELSPQRRKEEELKSASRDLYQLLFQGLDSLLSSRLYLISTREVEKIPFPLLRMDTADMVPRYLGVEHSLSRQYSINTMQRFKRMEREPEQNSVLGFAPTFNNELLAASELRQSGYVLPPLSYNQEELTGVENLGKGNYHYGKRATLSEFREEAPNHSILHFATHAISSKTDGLRSRVYLMDEAGDPAPLYASDIGNETLNADLVTLSACETGGGSQNLLEGTIGLTKAFLAAGARSVVASNWAVDDFATAELMESFYAAIRKGKAPDQALQYARKAYVTAHPGAHPSRWAAFEAYGGMVSPAWDEKTAWYESIWTYLGGFLLLLGGLAYKRMRYA